MTPDSRTSKVNQLLEKDRQKVAVRTAVSPHQQFVDACRHCLRAMCVGHWSVAFTQFTNATTMLCTRIVHPKAGANRNN